MKALSSIIAILCVLVSPPGKAEEKTATQDDKTTGAIVAKALLEEGRAAGQLPAGMGIRVSACLGESRAEDEGEGVPDGLYEFWEFTSNQVHRVEYETKDGKSLCHQVESRAFDTKDICRLLLEGKAIELQARAGKGPEVAFAGTRYHRGSRGIDVVWQGEIILDLGETNGPLLHLYRESDAIAFGALYEKLADPARETFKEKPEGGR
jgi:hypothetical protein